MALNDCTGLLTSAKHLEDPKILVKSFEAEVRGYLKEQVPQYVQPYVKFPMIEDAPVSVRRRIVC